jgi:hypothetical protein
VKLEGDWTPLNLQGNIAVVYLGLAGSGTAGLWENGPEEGSLEESRQ